MKKNSQSPYTPDHVRLAREDGDTKGARTIAKDLDYTQKELAAAGLVPANDDSVLTREDKDVGC